MHILRTSCDICLLWLVLFTSQEVHSTLEQEEFFFTSTSSTAEKAKFKCGRKKSRQSENAMVNNQGVVVRRYGVYLSEYYEVSKRNKKIDKTP